jgi:hypothetical protein
MYVRFIGSITYRYISDRETIKAIITFIETTLGKMAITDMKTIMENTFTAIIDFLYSIWLTINKYTLLLPQCKKIIYLISYTVIVYPRAGTFNSESLLLLCHNLHLHLQEDQRAEGTYPRSPSKVCTLYYYLNTVFPTFLVP